MFVDLMSIGILDIDGFGYLCGISKLAKAKPQIYWKYWLEWKN